MAREIVHNDDVTLRECGNEALPDPVLERSGVDRPIESLLRHEAAKAQAGDERDRLVMAVWNGGAQASPAPTAAAFARKIGGSAGFVDEDEPRRIELELAGEPVSDAASKRPRAAAPRHARTFFKCDVAAIEKAPQHG